MIETFAELGFWTAASLLAYAYIVFPALVLAVARIHRAEKVTPPRRSWPEVAVVIAAYNEEKHIGTRIQNVLDQEYPPERLTVMVGSDGSTDDTAQLAASVCEKRVAIWAYPENRGKASVLNDLVGQAEQEVIVFSDANTRFERDTVKHLVARFADPEVGAVCGELVLTPPDNSRSDDHRYWSLERRLKAAESTFNGLLGANGGIYAIRKALYKPLRPDTICDDFVIVMNIAVAGLRVIYEPMARAYEETPGDMMAEFWRRVRIGIGNYQSLFRYPAFFTTTNWSRRWTYVSHKVLRWITPHLLAVMFLASCVMVAQRPYGMLLGVQVIAYTGTWIVYATRQTIAWPGVLRSLSLFFVINAAFTIAFFRFLRGSYSGVWRRTQR